MCGSWLRRFARHIDLAVPTPLRPPSPALPSGGREPDGGEVSPAVTWILRFPPPTGRARERCAAGARRLRCGVRAIVEQTAAPSYGRQPGPVGNRSRRVPSRLSQESNPHSRASQDFRNDESALLSYVDVRTSPTALSAMSFGAY